MSAHGDRPTGLEYQDFILEIGPPVEGRRPIRVLESPAGDAEGEVGGPLTCDGNRRLFDDLVSDGRDLARRSPASSRNRLASTSVGQRLFDALFQGGVRDAYLRSLEIVRSRKQGLRIKIRLDPKDTDGVLLHSLPWELIFRADTREFLARQRRTPVVRYLEVPEPGELAPVPRPVRILTVMACPSGLPPLDLEGERASIEKVWREHEAVEVCFVPREEYPRATLETLRHALLEHHYHVLHFMGHGDFEPATGRGVVYFEDDDNRADPVDGESLADMLKDIDSLRLVVVNACRGAEAGDEAGLQPFAGVATALCRAGVPAVVAMQAPISDRAAIAFSRELYHRLAAGDPVDAAVTEGRRAVGRPGRTDEWAKPVLFLRSRDGRLWQPGNLPRPARPADWSWSPWGLVLLAVGALGVSLLAGLGALLGWDEPALRGASTVALVVLAVIASALVGKDPRLGRRASHLAVRNKAVGAALGGLGLAALAACAFAGPDLLCQSRCGALGCPPDGERRVFVGAFDNHLPEGAGLGLDWAHDAVDLLAAKLRQVPDLQTLDLRSDLAEERENRCVDLGIRGSVGQVGQDVVLEAHLSRRGGLPFAEVEVRGAPDPTGETILTLSDRLTMEILKAFGLELEDDLRRRILRTPTLDPDALNHNLWGVASFLERDDFMAKLHFETALELDPGYADAANNLGQVLLRRDDRAGAIGLFREAISSMPRDPRYHFNLGMALDLDGRPQEAVDALRAALELDPLHAPSYNNLGFALLELGKTREATRSLEKGLVQARSETVRAGLYKNLGRVAFEEGAYEASLDHFDKALKRLNPFPEALFYRALALERLGRLPEACEDWRSYEAVFELDDDPERRHAAEQRDRRLCEEQTP